MTQFSYIDITIFIIKKVLFLQVNYIIQKVMPQMILPLFTHDMTIVNFQTGVLKRDATVSYFQGTLPFYQHRADDRESFKHIIRQMLVNNVATRSELSRAFKIPARSFNRRLALYKEHGSGYFFSGT
jgi:hypothetical protein